MNLRNSIWLFLISLFFFAQISTADDVLSSSATLELELGQSYLNINHYLRIYEDKHGEYQVDSLEK